MERETDRTLSEKRVAVTGRLASLSQAEFVSLIEGRGGRVVDKVLPETSLLVVGAGGWPLQTDGRLTKSLETARRLRRAGSSLEIVSEAEFLRRLDAPTQTDIVRQYTLAELVDMLDVPAARLQAWVSAGLLQPVETRSGTAWFSFTEVARCRALSSLHSAGVSGRRLYRSLRALRDCLSGADALLDRLQLDGRRLMVRLADGALAEPHGQLLMEFGEHPEPAISSWSGKPDLFEQAVACEERGEWEWAERLYRNLLTASGPDADVYFNLANVLLQLDRAPEAVAALEKAVQVDPGLTDAWTNLGGVLSSLGRRRESLAAYRQALNVDPESSSALYGMAVALDHAGMASEARRFWRAYLFHEPEGARADYARSRLGG